MSKLQKIIFWLFAFLLFFVPIILWPYTSEVFEFNKMVLVYVLTVLILAVWLIKSIITQKIIFRRTILDIPLLIFFISQLISTFISIDFYTSVFGYYSRFNGGLLSSLCYMVIYWAFVSNFEKKDILKLINVWFVSAFIVSVYAVLEHFGIDKNIWVQDVQSRVFSTLGQPNWLAAWIVALIPITWALIPSTKIKSKIFLVYLFLSLLFFSVLLFTKSRSGILGMISASIIYWGLVLFYNFKENLKTFLIINISFLILAGLIGTQWTPSIPDLVAKSKALPAEASAKVGTALENGGTESGTIRKIVWQGALQIWQHYPIFGTGIETFAYSYYQFRPTSHNLTSEWNFIYNKAHNEFLNFAATSGTVGLLSYLILIGFAAYQVINKNIKSKTSLAFLAGFASLSVSNFFGFSVVPTQLEFFLFPALAFGLININQQSEFDKQKASVFQKILIFLVLIITSYLLVAVSRYWYADILYNRGKSYNSVPRPDLAVSALSQAIKLEPGQAIYYSELSTSYAIIAMAYDQSKDATKSAIFTDYAKNSIQKAVELSPANVNIRRVEFGTYIRLSTIDEKFLILAKDSLIETIKLAPTDAKLYYNLGVADASLGDYQKASDDFQRAIELKSDYVDARVQYAALLVRLKQNSEAKKQLEYILTNIDPKNQTAKQAFDELR